MPDLDSGHIFLTTLAPIRDSGAEKRLHASYTQAARIALARLPSALQSPATVETGINSPFARNRRTHLARMFVLNDVIYNGRNGKNALAASITGDDPAKPKPVDRLNTSYVVFCADIDAVEAEGDPLPHDLTPSGQRRVRDAYARELWETMQPELTSVYENCIGFERVTTADDFAEYLNACHVETTMPFHDYYLAAPEFHILPVKALLALVGVPALFTLLALILRLFGAAQMPWIGMNTGFALVGGAIVTLIAAVAAITFAMKNGEKPLPPAKYDDLPSVLKSLYLQQKFSDFVVGAQGAAPQELHARFGEFLTLHKPSDTSGPTQPPGVIAAPKA
jgi:hypothetical protein